MEVVININKDTAIKSNLITKNTFVVVRLDASTHVELPLPKFDLEIEPINKKRIQKILAKTLVRSITKPMGIGPDEHAIVTNKLKNALDDLKVLF